MHSIIIISFIFQILCTELSARMVIDNCKPKPKPQVPQHIIGYGSLMHAGSKNRTYPSTTENIPVEVKGFHRAWNCKGVSPTLSTTYLGAVRDPKSSFNGVYFTLANGEEGIKDFDTRERFYCRKELELDEFTILGSGHNGTLQGQFWIYVTKPEFISGPSEKYPIVQSYVDTWLSGCFELEEKFGLPGFAEKCVKSTGMWSKNWINDRIFPRRPFLYSPRAASIDKLLNTTLHDIFIQVKATASSFTGHMILAICLVIFAKIIV